VSGPGSPQQDLGGLDDGEGLLALGQA
jgi:hypothetical protein